MPKKMGVNSKAEAAKAQKSAIESEKKDRDDREKEEQYWRETEGATSRAAQKREEEAEKRAEAAAKRAEARRLAEQEEKELEKLMKKPDKKANRVAIPEKDTILYRGKLTDGSVFYSSFERGDPIEFELGSGQVIKGGATLVFDTELVAVNGKPSSGGKLMIVSCKH